jgi:hypothetical protein
MADGFVLVTQALFASEPDTRLHKEASFDDSAACDTHSLRSNTLGSLAQPAGSRDAAPVPVPDEGVAPILPDPFGGIVTEAAEKQGFDSSADWNTRQGVSAIPSGPACLSLLMKKKRTRRARIARMTARRIFFFLLTNQVYPMR